MIQVYKYRTVFPPTSSWIVVEQFKLLKLVLERLTCYNMMIVTVKYARNKQEEEHIFCCCFLAWWSCCCTVFIICKVVLLSTFGVFWSLWSGKHHPKTFDCTQKEKEQSETVFSTVNYISTSTESSFCFGFCAISAEKSYSYYFFYEHKPTK